MGPGCWSAWEVSLINTAPLIAMFMGPTWGPSGADRAQVGAMLAPWTLLYGVHATTWYSLQLHTYNIFSEVYDLTRLSQYFYLVSKHNPSSSFGLASNLLMCIVLPQEAHCQGYCYTTKSAVPTTLWVCSFGNIHGNPFGDSPVCMLDLKLVIVVLKITK